MLDLIAQHFAWAQNPVVLARQMLAGVSTGMLLFLISAGLSLIFGVLRILNFAHGALFMIGALIAVSIAALLPDTLAGFAAALTGAAAGLAVLGAAIETRLLRRIYRAPHEMQLLLTFALVFVLGDAAKLIWGREEHSVGMPAMLTGGVHAFGLVFPLYRLFLIAAGAVVAAGLWLTLYRTRWGVLVRAATMDRGMLSALGVNTRTLFTMVFALGAALAGLGGALAAPVIAVGPGAARAGAHRCVHGSCDRRHGQRARRVRRLAARRLGQRLRRARFPGVAVVLTFACMAMVLIVRPRGLLGSAE